MQGCIFLSGTKNMSFHWVLGEKIKKKGIRGKEREKEKGKGKGKGE